MMKSAIAALVSSVLVCGCATRPAATDAEKTLAMQDFVACSYETAKRLDDGMSDAATIALAVEPNCRSQFQKTKDLQAQAMNLETSRMFNAKADEAELGLVTEIVLKVRRDTRNAGRSN
jgi:hypothetical protein